MKIHKIINLVAFENTYIDQQKSFFPMKQTIILEAFTSMCLQHPATPSEVSL